MAEEMRGWIKEADYLKQQAVQNKIDIAAMKTQIGQLAMIVRDLVFIEQADDEGEHQEVLADHREILDRMIGEPLDE